MSPNFFAVTDFVALDGLVAAPVGPLYLLEFTTKNLENPVADPIGVYFYAGMRRYVWSDKFWAEYQLPAAAADQVSCRLGDCIGKPDERRLARVLEMLTLYGRSSGPTDQDTVDNSRTAGKVFYRVLYSINAAQESATLAGTNGGKHDQVA